MIGVQVLEGNGPSDPLLDPRLIADFTEVTVLIEDENMQFKFNPCRYWIGKTIVAAIFEIGSYPYGDGKCAAFRIDPKLLPPPTMLKNLRSTRDSEYIMAEIDDDPERFDDFDWHSSL